MIEHKITLTITSCKRIHLLEQTINSFFSNCLDIYCIDKILLIEDGSKFDDVSKINTLLKNTGKPYLLIYKSDLLKGHVASLNTLWDLIKTQYIFHLEDDWLFIKKDNFIHHAFNIMSEDNSIKQVLFRTNPDIMADGQIIQKTKSGIDYIRYNYIGQHAKDKRGRPAWSGWNLNPSLTNFNDLRVIGKFNHEKSNFEYEYSRRVYKNGFKVAYFPFNYCEHIGEGQSAYIINNTKR